MGLWPLEFFSGPNSYSEEIDFGRQTPYRRQILSLKSSDSDV